MFSVTPKTWRNWEGGDHTGDGWYLVTLDFAVARARTLGILPALDPRAAASAVPCRAPEELAALIGRALHDLEHGWTAAAADVLHRAAQLVDELRKAAL